MSTKPPASDPAQSGSTVVVIGGGCSGLAAAYELQKCAKEDGLPLKVLLLERSDKLGGVIRTQKRDGCILELGPDSFLSVKPAAADLARELGMGEELIGTNPEHRRSFIVHKGTLKPLPQGFYLLAPVSVRALAATPIISWPGKIRMAMEIFVKVRRDDSDESLADFVVRRMGREALDRIAQPMVAGIYTADPAKLSLAATFPDFLKMEREHGSIIRALGKKKRARAKSPADANVGQASGPRYSMFLALKGGLMDLIDGIARALPEGCVRLNTRVEGMDRDANGEGWTLRLSSGETLRADAVCLGVPANRAGELVANANPELARELKGIPYASVATVNIAFARSQVSHPLNGMGFVVPAVEKRDLLACTFSSVKFAGRAPEDIALFRAFMGGALRPDLCELDDDKMTSTALRELKSLVGLTGDPLFTVVSRHVKSMAQYHVGHLNRVARMREREEATPGLELTGNAFDGAGIPDCIRGAREAAGRTLTHLARCPSIAN